MSSNDFTARLRQQREDMAEKTKDARSVEDTFVSPRTPKEPVHRTTINIPVSVHEQLRREAFETGVPMADQLIAAWKAQRGLSS